MAGRSSPRLIEELAAYAPGLALFTAAPVAQRSGAAQPFDQLFELKPPPAPARPASVTAPASDGSAAGEPASAPGSSGDPAATPSVRPLERVDTNPFRRRATAELSPLDAPDALTLHGLYEQQRCHLELTLAPGPTSPAPGTLPDDLRHNWQITALPVHDGELAQAEYACSLTGARLRVRVLPPVFHSEDLAMFLPSAIEQRRREVAPERAAPSPLDAVALLDTVLANILNTGESRSIRRTNARAATAFNTHVLESRLDFTYRSELDEYEPPNVLTPAVRARLWRARRELALYALNLEQLHGMGAATRSRWLAHPLGPALARFLGAQTSLVYPRLSPRVYSVLGAVDSFAPEALLRRYDLQTQYDARNTPYYFDALAMLSQSSESELLQMRVFDLISANTPTLVGLREAYNALGLSFDDDEASSEPMADDFIADIFYQKVQLASESVEALAASLRVLAEWRGSDLLERVATAALLSAEDSYALLNLRPGVDDDVIAERISAVDDGSDVGALEARTMLRALALDRQSPKLLNLYEQRFSEPMELASAYAALGVAEGMDDYSIIAVYEINAADRAGQAVLEQRMALRSVGEARGSSAIARYLETGSAEDTTVLAPVGLQNIGNTCYLNSLLQFYYTVSPLREQLETFTDECDLAQRNDAEQMQLKKVGGRLVPYEEVQRSQQFVGALGKLFQEMQHTSKHVVQPTSELAYMALIPPEEDVEANRASAAAAEAAAASAAAAAAAKQPDLIDLSNESPVPSAPDLMDTETDTGDVEDLTNSADQATYDDSHVKVVGSHGTQEAAHIEHAKEMPLSPPASPDSRNTADRDVVILDAPPPLEPPPDPREKLQLALLRQQDVTECIENVMFQIEAAVKAKKYEDDGEQVDFVKELFYGTTLQKLQNATDGSNKRVKRERFLSILVDVAAGPRDIYEALDDYFSYDIVSLSEGETLRSITIERLPPILQVQIQRVQFDRATYQPFKSTHPLFFDETIYLDRYLETSDAGLLGLREQMRKLRVQRAELQQEVERLQERSETGTPKAEVLRTAAAWLDEWAPSAELDGEAAERVVETANTMRAMATRYAAQTAAATAKLAEVDEAIATLFAPFKKHGYRIHSLFIHRGQVSFGHYWIYIQDFETGEFRRYNDERIETVPRSEVLVQAEGRDPPTPYYLVFVREDFIDQVRSVVRDPSPRQNEADKRADVSADQDQPAAESLAVAVGSAGSGLAPATPASAGASDIELEDLTGETSDGVASSSKSASEPTSDPASALASDPASDSAS